MRSSAEYSIDLTAEELLQEPSVGTPAPQRGLPQSLPAQASAAPDEDALEIELTAEQIDALLSDQL